MKKHILRTLLVICLPLQMWTQEIKTTSVLKEVTVYRNQAKETRTSSVNITEGNIDVVISGITLQMIDQSLQVSVKGEADLLSATVRTNYFFLENAPKNDAKTERIQDSIKAITKEIAWIQEEHKLANGELNLLGELLRPNISKDGIKPSDIGVMADIYRTRFSELTRKNFDLTQKEERLQEKIDKYQQELENMRVKPKEPLKEIVLSFYSENAEDLQLRCSYLVGSAGWAPLYDIHVENTTKPVDLTYKARLFQNTGMPWKDVELTFSTANPSLNNNRPLMSPKYMDYAVYNFKPSASEGAISNMMQAERLFNDNVVVAGVPSPAGISLPGLAAPTSYAADPSEKDIMLQFELDHKQTIPSDGKEHVCKIKEIKIPATYKYHAVPKLDPAAFLLARITDYGQYNLLSGDANIFYGDAYVGQVTINPNVISDTLLISLGRDERIVVKRVRVANKYNQKAISGVQKETYEWETTIRNNKGVPIDIEILDQIPLTRRKEITVKMLDKSGGDYNESYGKVLWNYTIPANGSKKVQLKYYVEYPEGKVVQEQ